MSFLSHPARLLGAIALGGMLAGMATLGLPSLAGAETPAEVVTPAWDDSHMRSNHQRPTGPTTRPAIQGVSGYGQLEAGTAEPTRMAVPETLPTATQRQWQQGPLNASSAGTRTKRKASPASAPARGSALRAGAVSRGRR